MARSSGVVRWRRRRGRRRRGAALFRAGGPPRRPTRPAGQVAQEQPGARRVVRVFFGIGRRRSERRAVGRGPASVCGPGDSSCRTRGVLRGHWRQAFPGFQDTSPAAGGSVSHSRRAGLLLTTYYVLYLRQALLQTADQPQREQKTVWRRGGRGGRGAAAGGRRARRARAVLARAPPRRVLVRRVQPVQRRGGRAVAPLPHAPAAPTAATEPAAAATAADCTCAAGAPPSCISVSANERQAPAAAQRVVRGTRRRDRAQPLATALAVLTDWTRPV